MGYSKAFLFYIHLRNSLAFSTKKSLQKDFDQDHVGSVDQSRENKHHNTIETLNELILYISQFI